MSTKSRPCIRCKAEIPAERVKALPQTRLCLKCSEAVGSDFIVSYASENLAKTGSLKKNYGSLNVAKKRRRIVPLDEQPPASE